jgi:hypothetical protein
MNNFKKIFALLFGLMAVACADAPTQPEFGATTSPTVIDARVDLGPCDSLAVPAGHTLAARMYAQGVQIYRWNGSAWVFNAPEAQLTADADGNGVVGTHYRGPTWETNSGSKVVGAVAKRCTPDPTAIAWLLLSATSSGGPGVFDGVTYVQRVNTVGGLAPSASGNSVGEEARVQYRTVYLFYRAQ